MSKEKRLGRGLEALLGQLPIKSDSMASGPNKIHASNESPFGAANPPRMSPPPDFFEHPPGTMIASHDRQGEPGPSGIVRLPIDRIDSNPHQPRQEFDPQELQSLAESISAHGLLQPVVVRNVAGRYQLIAGERRLRAAQRAGWTDVPVNIVEADDRQTAELAIVENLQRKDLNPLEKAASFQRYLEQYGCTQDELARRLNMDRSTIANFIRLLELPEGVQDALRRGEITQGHARALLPLGDEREQIDFCTRIKLEGLNVRQTEAFVQQMIDSADIEPLALINRDGRTEKVGPPQNEHLAVLEQQFRAALGIKKVQITHNARGRGKLVIHFRDHEEFERILGHICGPRSQSRAG
ncbi:MAG: ParB/RepB/Spo0J family partition protein [Pirellulales bacterium]|nr:ParB/RepB/Spo0J family partition protein [Pirellulales bacterium]